MKTAVLFNDTRPHFHHGCDRVMSVLEKKLHQRGITVVATSAVRHDWWLDEALLRTIAQSDLLIINGEGTLHHGSRHGVNLLRLTTHEARIGKPLYLINALYQENPASWGEQIRLFDGVWARDSWSAKELSTAWGAEVGHFADLTLCDGFVEFDFDRKGMVFGDSVKKAITRELARVSIKTKGNTLVPTVHRIKSPKGKTGVAAIPRLIYGKIYQTIWNARYPNFAMMPDQDAYAAFIARSALHVTGRFHGACFSILTRTPFLTLSSNSWKLEALLADCGLAADRLVAPGDLSKAVGRRNWGFTAEEMHNIERYVASSNVASDRAFDSIAA